MATRILENRIKGLIYALLFVVMMLKSYFSETPIEIEKVRHEAKMVLAPMPGAWTR